MNGTENIAASSAGSPTRRETPATSSHAILRSLYATVRKFCPTWEEWQAAVESHPVAGAGTRPDVTLSPLDYVLAQAPAVVDQQQVRRRPRSQAWIPRQRIATSGVDRLSE
jgi:hypothetical protein